MLNAISRREFLGTAFSKIKGLSEVYVEPSFDFGNPTAKFYLLGSDVIKESFAFNAIQIAYTLPAQIYITYDPVCSILFGKQLLWRKGQWRK